MSFFLICFRFNYTGSLTNVRLSSGTYKIQLWGGKGGNSHNAIGGQGAYIETIMKLDKTFDFMVIVGGAGNGIDGGYNGGGNGFSCSSKYSGGGGGASDLRISDGISADVGSRILVAAGGSGATDNKNGYPGGDLQGEPSSLCDQTKGNTNGIGSQLDKSSSICPCDFPVSGGGGGFRGGPIENSLPNVCPVANTKQVSASGSSFVYTYEGASTNAPSKWDNGIKFYHPATKILKGDSAPKLPEGVAATNGVVIINPVDYFQKEFDCKKEEVPYRFFGEKLIEKIKKFFI